MKFFLVITFFCFFTSCSSKENDIKIDKNQIQNDSVFIKIKLDKNESISLRASNVFFESQIIEDLVNDKEIKLFAEDELSYIHLFKDRFTNDSGLYVKKGDSIEISYADNRFIFESLTRKKNNPNLNIYRDYYEYVKNIKPFDKIAIDKKDALAKKDLKKLLEINEKLHKVRLDFIHQYQKNYKIDKNYTDTFLNQYKFTKLRLDYWDIKTLGNNDQLTSKYNEILNFFQEQKIQVETLSLLFDIIIDYNKVILPATERNDRAKFAEYLFNSIKTDFSKKNRDILILELLRAGRNRDLLSKFYNEFKTFSKNESFINRAREIVKKNLEQQNFAGNENTLLKDSQGNTTTLKELLNKYKGHASYVDFWASWCAPCRLEMTKSLAASKKYTNIKFIYISTDQDEEQWKKANNKMLLNHIDSYLLLNESSSKFIKEINLSAIPRHIIFNKNSEISNTNAPGANDAQFENILKQY